MSNVEYRREMRAARLMYVLGFTRRNADALSRVDPWKSQPLLIRAAADFRQFGFTDEETAEWFAAGMLTASAASRWRRAGYTSAQTGTVLPWYQARMHTLPHDFIEDLHSNVPGDIAALAIKAGAKSVKDFRTLVKRGQDPDGGRDSLLMLAGLQAGQPDPLE